MSSVTPAQMQSAAAAFEALRMTRGDRDAVVAALRVMDRGSSYAASIAAGQLSVLAPHAQLVDDDALKRYAEEWRAMAKKAVDGCGSPRCPTCRRKRGRAPGAVPR